MRAGLACGILAVAGLAMGAVAAAGQSVLRLPELTRKQTYRLHLATSSDPTGGNADYKTIAPGATLTVLDADGPGMVSHIWFTMQDYEPYYLKRVVLRMYWDGEPTPSVEAPIGDFFGLGTGDYYPWQSAVLSVASTRALNCFFPMPYRRHARITITNEGRRPVSSFYFNIEYRAETHKLPVHTLYFHAQYRQAQPAAGWTSNWRSNGDPYVYNKLDVDGKDDYVWFEAKGDGQFAGVTMSVLQNQDGWWGEGDARLWVDGKPALGMTGTGSEDYFLGAWNFGGTPFSYQMYGAPVVGAEKAGSRSSVYRFNLDSPIPFSKSMKAGIEHGHANHRSDNFYSVAYWYQTEPHMAFPPLPPVEQRIPAQQSVGGPGSLAPPVAQPPMS